jgi:4-alpha-glucanotransferase
MFKRSSGLLCHVTSLPGPHGIGDLGDAAYEFVDLLAASNQHLWQVLPLGPVGAGDSPYDSRSSFAGNPLMISIEDLHRQGLLDRLEAPEATGFRRDRVEFRRVEQWKGRRLRLAYNRFKSGQDEELHRAFDAFRMEAKDWLRDFALYQALREAHDGLHWHEWPSNLRHRDQNALELTVRDLADDIGFQEFVQFIFDDQWHRLKHYANQSGVMIMGDIPIYVALDSADVWANQGQFYLDDEGQPSVQAGVPPDLFAKDGQLWGNPVYDWAKMAQDGYKWWEQRIHRVLELTDIVRIDHFRGFAAGWQVPAGEKTARNGQWVLGPGKEFFDQMQSRVGDMPIVVEDLGVITPDVEDLRDSLGYPGMKVLQFAFGDDASNPYLPHNVVPNSMVYTGTHDNDTTRGWYESLPADEQRYVRRYLGARGDTIHRDFIRTVWASVGVLACTPVQDVLGLGNDARMNIPGKAQGNWGWRLEQLSALRRRMGFISESSVLFGRDQPPLPTETDQAGSA